MLGGIIRRVFGDSIGTAISQFGEDFKKKVGLSSSAPSVRDVDAEDLASRAKRGGAQYVGSARVVTGKQDATAVPTMTASELTSLKSGNGGIRA